MRMLCKIVRVLIVAAAMVSLSASVIADEDKEIVKLYNQFNTQLVASGFGKASILLDKDNIDDAMRVLKRVNTDLLRAFYSGQMAASNEECHTHSLCRESDLIFLSVITFSEYEILSIQKINDTSIKMVITGLEATGVRIKLVALWLREDGDWKIDRLMKVPADWNVFLKKLHHYG
ncbi:MAG: hypothetical protein JMN25_03370 [gamma proteobacterium endosymbiont of Lamellibrachia anaximandri]|nr:hypothetical protein [gamma proteobacterium endosymbiont of Lamellibrachia anaximandri]